MHVLLLIKIVNCYIVCFPYNIYILYIYIPYFINIFSVLFRRVAVSSYICILYVLYIFNKKVLHTSIYIWYAI